jgi:membrane-anchored protein YejM (alkaline phosphatase superfamily)
LWLHYSDPHEPYAPPKYRRAVFIRLNNKIIKTFNLYDVTPITMNFTLKKGKNIITFTNLRYLKLFYSYPLRIENLKITKKKYDIKIKFRKSIYFIRRNLILLKDYSFFEITSPKKQDITLSFYVKPNLSIESKRILYKKEVEYMDKEIGKIITYLKKNGLYKKTVLIFVGDHGEGLGEYHGNFGHIHFLRPQYTKVPLIIKLPSKKRKIINNLISTIDITPTLLKYMRFNNKNFKFSGQNILKVKKNRTIFSYTYRPESFFNGVSIIHNNLQFIKYKGTKSFEEFMDLNKSNGYVLSDNIINNLKYLNIIKKMKRLSIIKLKTNRRKSKRSNFSEETKKILKSLGYL